MDWIIYFENGDVKRVSEEEVEAYLAAMEDGDPDGPILALPENVCRKMIGDVKEFLEDGIQNIRLGN